MPVITEHRATCENCGDCQVSRPKETKKDFRARLREQGWSAGLKKSFCASHKPKVKDPEQAAENYAVAISEAMGVPVDQVRGSDGHNGYAQAIKT